MKTTLLFLLICFINIPLIYSQNQISGIISDENGQHLTGVNIYFKGTLEGTTSTTDGSFKFKTTLKGKQTLVVSFIGFEPTEIHDEIQLMQALNIILKEEALAIQEIEITASTFSLGKSRGVKKMDPLDIVLAAGANGDILGALQSLPGTQRVEESGKLFVRGGSSRESQVFINGMHVLSPYTRHGNLVPIRSKFSPFIFKGINLSTGGYSSEYGQALSSVLPMETKDVSTNKKLGFQSSLLSLGGGGTYSWKNQSLSAQVKQTDLSLYNKILPDRNHWNKD